MQRWPLSHYNMPTLVVPWLTLMDTAVLSFLLHTSSHTMVGAILV